MLRCLFAAIVLGHGFLAIDASPNVKTTSCNKALLTGFHHCLLIAHDGRERLAGLHPYKDSDRVFEGTLMDASTGNHVRNSRVSMTLDDLQKNSAQIMFSDPAFDGIQAMTSNLESGESQSLDMDREIGNYLEDDVVEYEEVELRKKKSAEENKIVIDRGVEDEPIEEYKMNVLLFVEKRLEDKLGDDLRVKMLGVEAHMTTYYLHGESLGVKYHLNFLPYFLTNREFGRAEKKSFGDFRHYLIDNLETLPDVDAYALMMPGVFDGVRGLAFRATTCNPNRTMRMSLSAWLSNVLETARLVSHEIGHNLGARNGYQRNYRQTAKGVPCKVVKGFMRSYVPNYTQEWSPCTAEEFATYRQDAADKYGEFCLESMD